MSLPKHWSLEHRNVYCRVMWGDQWLMLSNTHHYQKGFRKAILKARWGKGIQVCDHLMHNSLIDWWWGSRVVWSSTTINITSHDNDTIIHVITVDRVVCSVLSDSLRPHELQPATLSVHGILKARILEWVAIPFSRGSCWLTDQTRLSFIAGRVFTVLAT